MATIKYLKPETAKLFDDNKSNEVVIDLLWGDRIEVLPGDAVNGRVRVKARGLKGYVKESDLMDDPLLEIYFIDVGQGDGILVITPDRKHILIDGGYNRKAQPHEKSAADFVDWKFFKDYGLDTITLDCMIASHCDADHYGGLWDLLNPSEKDELDCKKVHIKNFFHAGVSWWKSGNEDKFLGEIKDGNLVDLIDDRESIIKGLEEGSGLRLQGNWAKFLKCIRDSDATVARLAYNPEKEVAYLPGFENKNSASIKILGPVEQKVGGKPALKDFGSDSQNTNGNSVILRVDYGRARILITGDLNKASQQYLLDVFKGSRLEFSSDVAKSCHHGSDDCSYEFLETIHASASIISSGDDETHAHPRPNIVAACGITGYKKIDNDELITPLIFSTEISRSVRMGNPYKVEYDGYRYENAKLDIKLVDESNTDVSYKRIVSGALNPSDKKKTMDRLRVVDGIVYGLVNVRTDGNKILCATLNEGKSKWEIKKFNSRF